MTSPTERQLAFNALREAEPNSHLLDCPDSVVIQGDDVPDEPTVAGTWVTRVWAIQCSHGHATSKLTLRLLVAKTEDRAP